MRLKMQLFVAVKLTISRVMGKAEKRKRSDFGVKVRVEARLKCLWLSKGAFFWAYSGIGTVGISQTIARAGATLIPEWL